MRIFVPQYLELYTPLRLEGGAARHIQVLRKQPGDGLTLFNGLGGEWETQITAMGRSHVDLTLQAHHAVERELPQVMHLCVGMPANDRMDWLVEKATELGAASITPLMTQRTVIRLDVAQAQKKQAHWQAVAQAACEQCGRNRVPPIAPPLALATWLATHSKPPDQKWVVLAPKGTTAAATFLSETQAWPPLTIFSGPEGGWTSQETSLLEAAGGQSISLGPRVLRADTAPLAALVKWSQE